MITLDPQYIAVILAAVFAAAAAIYSAVLNVGGQKAVAEKAAEAAALNTAYLAYRDLVIGLQGEVSRLKGEVKELRSEVDRLRGLNERLEADMDRLALGFRPSEPLANTEG